jgi:large subunit ribosomal protein L22
MASRDSNKPRSGYTQLLSGTEGYHSLTTARAVNLDIHHKHCYQICRFLKGKTAGHALEYLEKVIKADGWVEDPENPDKYKRRSEHYIRKQARAIPYTRRSRKGKGGNTMAGHRKGKMGPGRFPVKASLSFIQLIRSAMENARHRYEGEIDDIDEMVITHVAAHRGQVRRAFRPRARGRASPHFHYQVNLELFLEAREGDEGWEDDGDGDIF